MSNTPNPPADNQRTLAQIKLAANKSEDLTDDELSQLDPNDQDSYKASRARADEIAKIKDPKEREIIELYEKGIQNYEIAKRVFEFVNNDTVGRVILTIRKHYADDFNEVEDINSTKGYSGVGIK